MSETIAPRVHPDWDWFRWYYGLFNHAEDIEASVRGIADDGQPQTHSEAAGTLDFIDNPLAAHAIASAFDLDDQSQVIDVGCGLGGPTRLYASSGASVVAVDLLEEQVAAHRQLNEFFEVTNIEVIQGDAQALPLPDSLFTHYFSIGALCHCYNRSAALAEAFRVLKPGGALVVVDINAGPFPGDEYFGERFWQLLSNDEYGELTEAAGFTEILVRDLRTEYATQLDLYIETMQRARSVFEPRFGGPERYQEVLETYVGLLDGLNEGQVGACWVQGRRPAAEPDA
jgi:ubiquinone/menaquinone biosynthesis C-methylase UbiE